MSRSALYSPKQQRGMGLLGSVSLQAKAIEIINALVNLKSKIIRLPEEIAATPRNEEHQLRIVWLFPRGRGDFLSCSH